MLGGLLYHFAHEPMFLELTMDDDVFYKLDDSKELLTMETFSLIFIIWLAGMGLGFVAMLAEIYFYKKQEEN
jgi:hypothetical protein